MINFTEKLCISYTCCGPTYRKSAMERLTKDCFSHPNLYYSILTDDKSYFNDVKLENFVVHELKDYYNDYPNLEKNEAFLESTDKKDYAEKFINQGYKFSFSTYRFHLIEAKKFGVCNVALLSTDSKLNFEFITDELFEDKNSVESLLSGARIRDSNEETKKYIVEIIKRKYNLTANDEVKEYDSAGRLLVFQDIEFMEMFFNMWDDVVNTLYLENTMYTSCGTYVMHDESILSVIYDVVGIHQQKMEMGGSLFHYYEISQIERFWTYPPITKTTGKFIITITGPLMKYRLAILKDACPDVKDYLIFFTDRESYQMYSEYHHFFNFIIMDDYRENYPISLKYEVFPNFKTEEESLKNISKFYGSTTGNYYPYNISRFIFPYLIENDILNFAIICSDTILSNDADFLKTFFDAIPSGCCYAPNMGVDNHGIEIKMSFWQEVIQPLFPQIKLETPFMSACDGYFRGFHFRNKEDMKLFFDMWNAATDHIFTNSQYGLLNGNNGLISEQEWISGHIIGFFEYQLNYIFKNAIDFTEINRRKVMFHCSRSDDTFYMDARKGT